MPKISIDPVTRIEGHLKVEAQVDEGKIVDATSHGEMFRGWEIILKGRNPLDAQQIAQRICGVCPAVHAQAATLNLDSALNVKPPENGRLIRNLMLGANYIQSHLLHFYHLTALDYVDITAILNYNGNDPKLTKIKGWVKSEVDSGRATAAAPFLPRYEGDYIANTELNIGAIAHYLEALEMRRKAQEMLAIFGGRMPHELGIMPGGATTKPTVDRVTSYASRIKELQSFIDKAYLPDVLAVAEAYKEYFAVGKGCGNLLAYGAFEEDVDGAKKLFPAGTYIDGKVGSVSPEKIAEYVKHSKFSSPSGLHPSKGETEPAPEKDGAYSWLKSPRYDNKVIEVGPLARIGITYLTNANEKATKLVDSTLKKFNADVTALFSVLGRHAARAIDCKIVADRCAEWVMQLDPAKPVHSKFDIPETGNGMGLTDGPRGALGHWITISDKKIERYQAVVPTTWNASPADDMGQKGPIEQALIGTTIKDPENPIEAVRIVRSFDPCLACAIHVVTPEGQTLGKYRVL
jgi:Ni,Fe-hydrogenase I large subunit